MRPVSHCPALICLLLVLSGMLPAELAAQPREGTIDHVLERYVQNIGGRAALERIRSVRMSGTVSYPDGSRVALTVLKKKPNRVRVTLDTGIARLTQGYDGELAWVLREAGGTTAVDRLRSGAAEIFIREAPLENLLVNPRDSGVVVKLGPDTTLGRTPLHQVIATLPDGSRFVHLLEHGTFLERRILEYDRAGELVSELIPSRFESHGGVLFATQIVRLRDGETASTLVLERIELNVGILDTAFAPPPGLPEQ